MQQITENVFTFENLMLGRVYLIQDPDGLTIIDTGIGPAVPRIVRQLGERGFALDQVKRILITHGHGDHIGGLPKLKQLTGAPAMSSPVERDIIEKQGRSAVPRIESTIDSGDTLDILGGIQVVGTPGHSPGQIAFWQPQKRILFAGDTLMYLMGKLRLPFRVPNSDMAEAKRSIKHIAELEPSILCFGHGQPMTHDTADTLRRFADSIKL